MGYVFNNSIERKTPLRSKTALKRGGKVTIKCRVCGRFFQTWPYRVRDGIKTCSMKCSGVLKRNRSVHKCAFCENEFSRSVSQVFHRGAKYCSRDCSNKGIAAECERRPVRDKYGRSHRAADRQWQLAVRERDGYICQRCGRFDRYVHAHHVAPRGRRPDLRLDVSNGKCLCNSCHSWVHEHPKEATTLGLLSGDSYELARKKLRGEAHGMAKLNAERVAAMRRRRTAGESVEALAAEYGIHRATASKILNGHTWNVRD